MKQQLADDTSNSVKEKYLFMHIFVQMVKSDN